jgi:hypothetical protein
MDELHLTRSALESMTTVELIRIADSFGIEIPPGLDRVFVIEELLDIASLYESLEEQDGSFDTPNGGLSSIGGSAPDWGSGREGGAARRETVPETTPQDTFSPALLFPREDPDPEGPLCGSLAVDTYENHFGTEDFPGSVPFPKQYNITFVEVMIRDPLWAFVFWEIKEHDREVFERMPGFEGYCLRVDPLKENGTLDRLPGFTVSVSPEDTAWYVGFPSENTGSRFRVELCACLEDRIDVLASSRAFTMPRLQENAGFPGQCFSQLALLCGAEEFPILRNPERKFRLRYGKEASRPGK